MVYNKTKFISLWFIWGFPLQEIRGTATTARNDTGATVVTKIILIISNIYHEKNNWMAFVESCFEE